MIPENIVDFLLTKGIHRPMVRIGSQVISYLINWNFNAEQREDSGKTSESCQEARDEALDIETLA